MSSQAEREGPWVIMARVPEIVDNADGSISPGRDIGFVFNLPPRVSVLQLPARIARFGSTGIRYPYIASVDQSAGRLLFCAAYHSGMAEHLAWLTTKGKEEEDFTPSNRTGDRIATHYYICDGNTGKATLLPEYYSDCGGTLDPGNVGMIRRGDEFLVAELQCGAEYNGSRLCCYSTATRQWVTKRLIDPANSMKLCNNGAVSHAGRLLWVDLSAGIYTCDPFADEPRLRHVPFPRGCELPDDFATTARFFSAVHHLYRTRCVNVSRGKLMYVQIDAKRVISMWSLLDGPLDDPADVWSLEHMVPLADVWADEGYKAAGLEPQVTPVIALVHPRHLDIVYLIQSSKLFSVDLRQKKLLDWHPITVHEASTGEYPSSGFLQAWELPPKQHPSGVVARFTSWMSETFKRYEAGVSLCMASICMFLFLQQLRSKRPL